jgi:diguanylate cyclase (GGDEF)-like protein
VDFISNMVTNHKNPLIIAGIIIIVAVIALLLYPFENSLLVYSIRGTILFAVLGGLGYYLFIQRQLSNKGLSQKRTSRELNTVDPSTEKPEKYFDQLMEIIFEQINTLNPEYKGAFYVGQSAGGIFTLQNNTSNEFSRQVNEKNSIFTTMMKKTGGQIFQQNLQVEAWKTIFGKKTWKGSECALGARVTFNRKPVGCLLIYIDHFSKVNELDVVMVKQFSDIISHGMKVIDRLESYRRNLYLGNRVNQLYEYLNLSSNDRVIYNSVVKIFSEFLTYDKLSISIKNLTKKNAMIHWVDGYKEDIDRGGSFNINNTLHGISIHKDITVETENWLESYPDLNRFKDGDRKNTQFKSALIVPMEINESHKGTIGIERFNPMAFNDQDKWILDKMRHTLGGIIKWHLEFETVRLNSIRDELTGLLNYKAFLNRFKEEISRANRFKQKMSLVVLDIDRFKTINDSYGHEFGNTVLRELSSVLKNSVRNIDVVGRYGGEEFGIVLVDTDAEKSKLVAGRIVENIAHFPLYRGDDKIRTTMSAGIAEYPADGDQIKTLIEKADQAMYITKRKGGNGVTVFSVPEKSADITNSKVPAVGIDQ